MIPLFSDPRLANTLFNTITNLDNLKSAYAEVKEECLSLGDSSYIPFEESLEENLLELQHDLRTGNYVTLPLIRYNNYDVLSVKDRTAQKAVVQVIKDLFDPCFLDSFHGYKQGTDFTTYQHLLIRYLEEGYEYYMDLQELFYLYDYIPYEYLIQRLQDYIDDERLIQTIRSMIPEKVYSKGHEPVRANLVGSEVSELLYNIYMCDLDVYSENKPYKLARLDDLTLIVLKKESEFTRALKELYIQLLGMNFIPLHDPKAEDYLPRLLEDMICI